MSATAQEGSGTHQLQAILPDWCALTWQHALICLTFVVLFLHLCYLPVPTGQIWHEVANGRTIVNSGVVATDQALPYSEGVRALTTNWLGQACVYWTYHFGGPEWLSCLFALIQLATLAIWAFVFQRISGSAWAALLVAPILLASSIDVNALGSSTFGLFTFALVALTIVSTFKPSQDANGPCHLSWRSASMWQWIIVTGLFVLWANLDVSVLLGVGLLGAFALSRLIGILAKRKNHASILRDTELHHRTWLFEICLIATLLQPNGFGLWQSIFWSANNPIIHAFGGWSPVTIASWRGAWIALAWLGWIVASRKTTSIPLWNVGSAILMTLLVACFQSQIVWFATTMCFLTVALLPRITQRSVEAIRETPTQSTSNPSLKFAFTLVCGLLIWIAFSLSPIGTMAMAGKPRTPEQLYGSNTPLGATAFLKEDRPEKVVWTPKYWADHLQVEGAPTQVFANLNEALLTPRIEKDYQSIYFGGQNWQRLLRRYQVDDLVVDKENQTDLMRELRVNSGPFEKIFEDELSVIYRRSSNPVQPQPIVKANKPTLKPANPKTHAPATPKQFVQQPELNQPRLSAEEESAPEPINLFEDQLEQNETPFIQPSPEQQGWKPRKSENSNRTINSSSSESEPTFKKPGWKSRKPAPSRANDLGPANSNPEAARLFDDRSTSSTSIFED